VTREVGRARYARCTLPSALRHLTRVSASFAHRRGSNVPVISREPISLSRWLSTRRARLRV